MKTESQIPTDALVDLKEAGYRIVGSHSGVEICHWTKESLRSGRVCYKQKWYGIESHRCLEMSPAITFCTHQCQFCWRKLKWTSLKEPIPDEPKDIIDWCIEARRLLLTGFKGNIKVDKKKWEEANKPTNAAISLAGEPTLYPRISDLVREFRRRGFSTFLVTNGTRPDRLESLEEEPTNLYISLCAPDEETYLKVNRPLISDGWKKINESLELMKSFNCRTILRLTLVKGLNLKKPEKFAKMILKAEPDFIEPKAYMWVGESQERLPKEAMPTLDDIRKFAQELAKYTGYIIEDEDAASRVVLLSKN
jgi:tRNA wybutosine-synthesizing protein 1